MPLSRYALNTFCAPELSELTQCGALELEQLPLDLEGVIYNFVMRSTYQEPTRKLAINLVRRTDHAVFEYQQGRRLLLEYLSRHPPQRPSRHPSLRLNAILRAMCHLEQCILNLYMAVEILENLTARKDYYKKGQGQVEERLHSIYINIKHFPQLWQKDAAAITPIWLTNDGIASLQARVSWPELKAALDTLILISKKLMMLASG